MDTDKNTSIPQATASVHARSASSLMAPVSAKIAAVGPLASARVRIVDAWSVGRLGVKRPGRSNAD